MTSGELARAAGVGPQTIRYYERRGLLPPPPRTSGGRRRYGSGDLRRVRFIRHAQVLGFTLEEVQELLALRVEPGTPCRPVATAADLVLGRIALKLRSLENMRRTLTRLRKACDHATPTSDCPILEALEEDDHEPAD